MTQFVTKSLGSHQFKVVDPSTYPFGSYEWDDELPQKYAFWADIKPVEVVMDLGASWGGWTLPALAQGATVLAVEPSKRSLHTMIESVEENGWRDRLKTYNGLIWDETPIPEEFRESAVRNFGGTDDLPIVTLKTLVDIFDVRRLDRIKFDVEGAELPILRGGLKVLKRYRPLLVIENHNIKPDHKDAHLIPYAVGLQDKVISILEAEEYRVELFGGTGGGNPYIIGHP